MVRYKLKNKNNIVIFNSGSILISLLDKGCFSKFFKKTAVDTKVLREELYPLLKKYKGSPEFSKVVEKIMNMSDQEVIKLACYEHGLINHIRHLREEISSKSKGCPGSRSCNPEELEKVHTIYNKLIDLSLNPLSEFYGTTFTQRGLRGKLLSVNINKVPRLNLEGVFDEIATKINFNFNYGLDYNLIPAEKQTKGKGDLFNLKSTGLDLVEGKIVYKVLDTSIEAKNFFRDYLEKTFVSELHVTVKEVEPQLSVFKENLKEIEGASVKGYGEGFIANLPKGSLSDLTFDRATLIHMHP